VADKFLLLLLKEPEPPTQRMRAVADSGYGAVGRDEERREPERETQEYVPPIRNQQLLLQQWTWSVVKSLRTRY
jgi:hypothetical protein